MKFKTLKVSSTKNIANKTGNRIAKQKLKEAAKDLRSDVLRTASESFVKIHLPEQKPSSIVNYLRAPKPIPTRQKQKPITSTPHLQFTNNYEGFSNAGSSILSPIIREESAERIKRAVSSETQIDPDESDSEVERPKSRNKKRTNCEPAPNVVPSKKRDPLDRIDTSSDIVFDQQSSAKAKSKIKRKTKKHAKRPDPQSPSQAELVVPLVPLENESPQRDRSEFVNKTPRSVNFTKVRDDPDIEAWAKSIGLVPVASQGSNLNSPSSPKPRYDSRSARAAMEKAQASTSSYEAGQPVARNLLDDLQAEKSPIIDKNDKSPVKKAKANHKNPQKAATESESDISPAKKRKASKATKKKTNVQNVGPSPKIKIIENLTFVNANKVNQQDNLPHENPVEKNDRNKSKTPQSNNNESVCPPFNMIEEIEARKLQKQMPPPPAPVQISQEDSETSYEPSSDDDQGNNNKARPAFDVLKNFKETMASRGTNMNAKDPQLDEKRRIIVKKSLWNNLYKELDSYAQTVTHRGELTLSESSGASKESEELFGEVDTVGLAKRAKSKKEKIKNLKNALKKLHSVKKNSKLVDRQIQTERLSSAPIFRQSTVSKNKKSKSRVLDMSNKSPNIYDSLEQGNEIDALGFSNFDEPTLSFKHKPFRCDTPSRSMGHLSWTNNSDVILLPNSPSNSDTSLNTIENDLSPKPHNNVKKFYKNKTNTTVASTNRRKSKLVQPNQVLSGADLKSPRPMTRSLARSICQNNADNNARKKLDFNKTPTENLAVEEPIENTVSASKKRRKKSLDKILAQQTPQLAKEAVNSSKKSSSKNPTLEPPQFTRQDVSDMLKSPSFKENQQQSPRNSNPIEESDDEILEISKNRKQRKKSSLKLNPLAEPFQSLQASHIEVLEVSGTKQNKSVSDLLRNSQVEVPGSSGKSRTHQNSSKQLDFSSLRINQVPESSGKGRKQQTNSKKQVSNISSISQDPESSGKAKKQQKHSREPSQNLTFDDEVPGCSGTSSKNKKQHQQSLQNDVVDIHMDDEIAEVSRSKQQNSSRQNSNKENHTLEGEIQSISSAKGRQNNNKKKNQALKDKTRSNNENATEGKSAKRETRKNTLDLDEMHILPQQDGRRVLRVRKPPRYCPIIDFATSLKTHSLSPKLFKKLNARAAQLVTSFTASQTQKGRTSRLTNRLPIEEKSSGATITEEPIAEEMQADQQNVSDSVLMPPPPTNLIKTRNLKDSAADSGIATSVSVQKKSGRSRGGKKTAKVTKTLQEVPETPCVIEEAPTTSSPFMNQSEGQSMNSQNSEEADSLYQTVDGKVFKTQFVCTQPSLLNYTSVGNLFVNEITKDPNNQYTVGYLRLGQGESKKVASSTKFSFVYVIIAGIAEVRVENKICTVYQGGYFWVPVGTIYSIKNASLDSYLEINFTRIRN